MDQVTAELNFIKIVLGSFVKYNDPAQRENYLKSKLELIREEELKDQLFGYVGMSEQELKVAKDKLDDLLLELQKKENLLQEEKNKQWGSSAGNRCFDWLNWLSSLLVLLVLFFLQEILFLL